MSGSSRVVRTETVRPRIAFDPRERLAQLVGIVAHGDLLLAAWDQREAQLATLRAQRDTLADSLFVRLRDDTAWGERARSALKASGATPATTSTMLAPPAINPASPPRARRPRGTATETPARSGTPDGASRSAS